VSLNQLELPLLLSIIPSIFLSDDSNFAIVLMVCYKLAVVGKRAGSQQHSSADMERGGQAWRVEVLF